MSTTIAGADRMARRGKSTEPPLVLDQHRDGPPRIQRNAIVTNDGVVIREAMVEQIEWPDPTDMSARLRRATVPGARVEAKKVTGYKRVWTIDTLHRSSPAEITDDLVKAATRFVDDHQRREGALVGGWASSSGDLDPVDVRVAAGIRYDEAAAAMGLHGSYVVYHVAILNWTITALALHLGINRDRSFGHLQSALERLREHYDQGKRKRTKHTPVRPSAPLPEPKDTGLPPDRSGRWDRKPARVR